MSVGSPQGAADRESQARGEQRTLGSTASPRCLHGPGGRWEGPSSAQFSRSVVSDSLRPHGRQASLSIANSWRLLKLMSIGSVKPSNHLILCRPLLLLPSIFPSIRVFSNESVLYIRCPKDWREFQLPHQSF